MKIKKLFKNSSATYSKFLKSNGHRYSHYFKKLKEPLVDIEFFQRSISLHYQHAYATKKWQNWIYRFVFFSFGLLFLILATIIFFKTVNFACCFYFQNSLLVKNCINMICLLFSGSAFIIGYQIHPEKEAMQYLMRKVEKELNYPAKHLQIEFNTIIANLFHETPPSSQTLWINKTFDSHH